MASSDHCEELPECAICKDVLEDPRALPCGHTFCGPPRRCLEALKQGPTWLTETRLKCAICGDHFRLTIESLKPLYGLRDYLTKQKDQAKKSKKSPNVLNINCDCRQDKKMTATFWCWTCLRAICNECVISVHHKGHQFAIFEPQSKTFVEQTITSIKSKTAETTKSLRAHFDTVQKRFEKAKSDTRKLRQEITERFNSLENSFVDEHSSADVETLNWLYNFTMPEFDVLCRSSEVSCQTDKENISSPPRPPAPGNPSTSNVAENQPSVVEGVFDNGDDGGWGLYRRLS